MVIDERAGSSAQFDLCDCDVCMCWDERHRPAHVCDRFVRVMMLTAYLDRDSKARTLVMLFFVCAVVVSSLGGARTVALHAWPPACPKMGRCAGCVPLGFPSSLLCPRGRFGR